MGKKSSKESSTTTNAPPAWAVPIIKGGANAVMNNFNANQGNLQALQGQITGSIMPGIQSAIDNRGGLDAGSNYASNVMGGQYLNSNPYVEAMAHQGEQDAGNAVNSTFSLAGRTGGNNHATDLARGVAQAGNSVRFQNYQNERGLQNQAASLMPSYYQSQFSGYTPLLGATQLAGQLPYYGSSSLGTIGSLLGGYGTSSTSGSKPGGWGTDILSAGMAALPFILSDRRAKRDIHKVGEAKDGLGIYHFIYKSDSSATVQRGVMADEVEKLRPWALGPRLDGMMTVNYSALGGLA